jgi:hypothetical protein
MSYSRISDFILESHISLFVVVVPVVVVVSGGGKVAEILCCVAPEV